MSQLFFKIVKEHVKASKEELTDLILSCQSLDKIDLHICSQVKGQIHSLEAVQDIHEFISEEDLIEFNKDKEE